MAYVLRLDGSTSAKATSICTMAPYACCARDAQANNTLYLHVARKTQ
jgi:hypothetical protein